MYASSTPKLWDNAPKFHPSVSERDADTLRSIAKAMLAALYPASSTWKVQYAPHSFTVGCKVPKDAKVTLESMRAPQRVSPGRVDKVWCEWNARQECLYLCCRVQRAPAKPVSGKKRARLEEGDEPLEAARDEGR
jgi:hypothetical protein